MTQQQRFKSLGEEAGYRMCIDELVEPLRKENSELKERVGRLEGRVEELTEGLEPELKLKLFEFLDGFK